MFCICVFSYLNATDVNPLFYSALLLSALPVPLLRQVYTYSLNWNEISIFMRQLQVSPLGYMQAFLISDDGLSVEKQGLMCVNNRQIGLLNFLFTPKIRDPGCRGSIRLVKTVCLNQFSDFIIIKIGPKSNFI